MNRISPSENWPRSWLESYEYDRQEIYGEPIHYGYTYAYQNRLTQTLEMVRKVVAPPASIFDLAAAQGNYSLYLAEAGYDVTWNDLREELIGYVKLKHSHGTIRYQPGNVFELPAVQRLYDLILTTEIIEHVAHPDEFLQQVASFVKPGGFIVMTTPNGEYLRNRLPKFSNCPDPYVFESVQFKPNADGHIFLLHQDEVYGLAKKSGLVLREFRFFTTPLTNGHMKTEYLLRVLPRFTVEWLERLCQNLPIVVQRRLCTGMGAVFQKP